MIEVLDRRYPAAADLLVEMQDDPWFGTFTDTSSFTGLMDSVMTEVHEGTHGWDWNHALGQPYFGYWIRADLVYEPSKIDGFPRSEIAPMLVDDSTSLYAGTYLTGTQGTYGWYELLDEMNAYINGMGAIAAVGEHIPWGISGRDGAVALLAPYSLPAGARRCPPASGDQRRGDPGASARSGQSGEARALAVAACKPRPRPCLRLVQLPEQPQSDLVEAAVSPKKVKARGK